MERGWPRMISKQTKRNLKRFVFLDNQVASAYRQFQKDNPEFDAGERPLAAASYIMRLNWGQYRRKNLNLIARPSGTKEFNGGLQVASGAKWRLDAERIPKEELFELLKTYEVVSFDIFDTVLFRTVDDPEDVFRIMGLEMDFTDFRRVRKEAESRCRRIKKETKGTREIVLSEIYDLLEKEYGIDRKWEKREIELEKSISLPNPYMKYVYDRLLENGNIVVFTSDMYLPKPVIEDLLEQSGYSGYKAFYLSNEFGICKGDGKLQLLLQNEYPGKTIIHVGDNEASDVNKSINAGIDAYFNHDQRLLVTDQGAAKGDIAGSIYRALINNNMNCGAWEERLHFDHGYRVGGILVAGFCSYLNELVAREHYDRILFCARDCEIVWKVYNQFFKQCDNEYIAISRYAILQASSERYLHDYLGRSVLRHAKLHGGDMTVKTILEETGFDYLVDKLERYDIEQYLFPNSLKRNKLEDFLYCERETILKHNKRNVDAAKCYFETVLGDARNVLIVDIGWSGTCISALDFFLQEHFPERNLSIAGALMATSRNDVLTSSISSGRIHAFLYSPQLNMDQTRFFMPGGRRSTQEMDLIHMPLEYLFTSRDGSLAEYSFGEDGTVSLKKTKRTPSNSEEIRQMQDGMIKFCRDFLEYKDKTISDGVSIKVNPYLASAPLRETISDKAYSYSVYKNFVYDAVSPLFDDGSNDALFGSLFDESIRAEVEGIAKSGCCASDDESADERRTASKGRVLFVSPEMIYTGAPRSLLRICKVAKMQGYEVSVWTAKAGPFMAEYSFAGIPVLCVKEDDLKKDEIKKTISGFDVAICNTIATDAYVRALAKQIPVAWYIREATNIPDFCNGNEARSRTLRSCRGLVCVSDYAAEAIGRFTDMPIKVVKNAVEDYADTVAPHEFAIDGVVRFVQLGTMEYRKGYDLCISAYKSLPEEYKQRVEMYFAGGFINSASSYCSYIFNEIKKEPNIHYLGVVKGEEKKNALLSSMDVVMVASRDESCSLVALEGAMLSKPLLVTENVGAKYMVSQENGYIVPSGDVSALAAAIMKLVDNRSLLAQMGEASRKMYDAKASMEAHSREIVSLIEKTRHMKGKAIVGVSSANSMKKDARKVEYVLSLTSHPGRINSLAEVVESLLAQTASPKHLALWLSSNQFPGREADLPEYLLEFRQNGLEICWCDDDLRPHKKYLYAAQKYPDLPLIIVDDDTIYDREMAETLLSSYLDNPHAVSCMRANLILFKPDGSFRSYDNWVYDYRAKRGEPSYQLLPTGVGGVLYPPRAIPEEAFNGAAIKKVALDADDLWLKFFATAHGYPAVVARKSLKYRTVEGSQDVGLWNANVFEGKNDQAIKAICEYFDDEMGGSDRVVRRMRCLGSRGEWLGVDAISYDDLLISVG